MAVFQLTHLRFDCVATTAVHLHHHHAGNSIRNAIANVMLHATCPLHPRPQAPPPEHVATCPACWLLAANLEPGSVVRAYAIVPPIPPIRSLAAGERFAFGVTLFGPGFAYLPYIVLAAAEAGRREGIGPGRREGLGRFAVVQITAVDPLRERRQIVLAPGETLVNVPTVHVDTSLVADISTRYLGQIAPDGRLRLHFLSPLRLVEEQQPLHMPDFTVLFKRLLYRLDSLQQQFGGADRRPAPGRRQLERLAEQVRLVDAQVRWEELMVRSGRRDPQRTPLSGLVGTAVYRSTSWEELLPYLIWAQIIQVGKSTAKGNGVVELDAGGMRGYWDWMRTPVASGGVANVPAF